VKTFSRGSFIAGSAGTLAACSGGNISGLPGKPGALSSSLSKRIASAPMRTALGHTGFQLSSNPTNSAFALHTSAGDFASSLAVGSRFIRATHADGSRTILDTSVPLTTGWYQLTGGVRFRFKKLKKTGSLGLLAIDKAGSKVMIHFEKGGELHFSTPDGKGAKGRMPQNRRPRNREEGFAAFESMMDNKRAWSDDDDFRGANGDYPAGIGWGALPAPTSSSTVKSSGSRRPQISFQPNCQSSSCWSIPASSWASYSTFSVSRASFSVLSYGSRINVGTAVGNTLACEAAAIALTVALVAAIAGSGIAVFAGCVVGGVITLGVACVAAILGTSLASAALTAAAIAYADACLK
jgi:hypothetical protein